MLEEIEIEYDTPYDQWQSVIIDCLNARDIVYNMELPEMICRSLKQSIFNKLKEWKYKPKETLQYRQGLVRKLKREGLKLSITSNNILWKYLEYFTDVENYSACFNISMIVIDYEKASNNLIFVGVSDNCNNNFLINTDINYEENKSIKESFEILSSYKNKYPFMPDLLNIIQKLIERS